MSDKPHWLGGKRDRQKVNRRSARQERERAREVGGTVQPGSGSSWRAPRDVKTVEHLEELKFTDQKGYTIDVREWERLATQAALQGKEPRLIVEFPERGIRLIVEEG